MNYRAEAVRRTGEGGVPYLGWDIVGEDPAERIRVEDVTEDAAFALALAEALTRLGAERVRVKRMPSLSLKASSQSRKSSAPPMDLSSNIL